MESNWRMNVRQYFGADSGYKFFARVTGPLLAGWWISNTPGSAQMSVWENNVPGRLPIFMLFYPPLPGHPRFPYGITVAPD